MPSAEFDHDFRVAPSGFGIAAIDFEYGLEVVGVSRGLGTRGVDCARDRLLHQLPRLSGLAELPNCVSEVDPRRGAGVGGEALFWIPVGIVNPQRLLEMRLRLGELALDEARHSEAAARGRRLRPTRLFFRFLRFASEGLGSVARQPQFAAP